MPIFFHLTVKILGKRIPSCYSGARVLWSSYTQIFTILWWHIVLTELISVTMLFTLHRIHSSSFLYQNLPILKASWPPPLWCSWSLQILLIYDFVPFYGSCHILSHRNNSISFWSKCWRRLIFVVKITLKSSFSQVFQLTLIIPWLKMMPFHFLI